MPDDSIGLQADITLLTDFFSLAGVKKIEINFQCFFLQVENERYITISKTSRDIVVLYIADKQLISKMYFDKNNTDVEGIALTIRKNMDYLNDGIPVYVNNINSNMDRFGYMGKLISLTDLRIWK